MSTVPHPTSDPVGFDDLSDTSVKPAAPPLTVKGPDDWGHYSIQSADLNGAGDYAGVAYTKEEAALFAAAPDLLRELLQARNYVAVVAKKTTDERVHRDLAQIDAAIAKARS